MRYKPAIVVPCGLGISAISAALLFWKIQECVRGREEYNSWVPFYIGMAIGVPLGLWPVSFIRASGWRLIVRSVVFTLFLAPIPFGPEGSLVPALLGLVYPPLLAMYPYGVPLMFCAVFGLVASAEVIWQSARPGLLTVRRRPEPTTSPRDQTFKSGEQMSATAESAAIGSLNTTSQVLPVPVFGSLSLLAWLLGPGFAAAVDFFFPRESYYTFIYAPVASFLTIIPFACGILFAFRALKRHERFRALPWIGLVVNVVALLLGLLFFIRSF